MSSAIVTATIAKLNESRTKANAAIEQARLALGANPSPDDLRVLTALLACAQIRVEATDAQIRILEQALPPVPSVTRH